MLRLSVPGEVSGRVLTNLDAKGSITDQAVLDSEVHQNSIRHIALDHRDHAVAALQWQGPRGAVPAG
ncbi:DUF1513 domain-containing protein [Aliiroseovarius sp. PrR006]|uniref:DUF1513 domain-containing protein n=1 Tax=Aliiroseovarius sp. PrR006 TaxID=2706883 RepID=UPI00351A6007